MYRVTREGMDVAKWDLNKPSSSNSKALSARAPEPVSAEAPLRSNPTKSLASATDSGIVRRTGSLDRMRPDFLAGDVENVGVKDSHTARLTQILEEPALRSLFREFLRANFCEENLSFWLDVQDFKRRFNTSSSAAAAPGALTTQRGQGLQAMEKHQLDLISMAFVIYNTYLAPASPCELNIDHQLRGELITYMNDILDVPNADKGELIPGVANNLQANQLQNMVVLYERIQSHIFRLMATDSVPKFVKTERFLTLMQSVFQYQEPRPSATSTADDALAAKAAGLAVSAPPKAADNDLGRAYLTVSQAANEKQVAASKQQTT